MSTANRAFRAWVSQLGLIDLGHYGPAYTWSNKKEGRANISERLDRTLGSLEWTLQFPSTSVFHWPRFQSDHLPILIRTEPIVRQPKKKFKCENWWLFKEEFQTMYGKIKEEGSSNWEQVQKFFKREVKQWVKKTKAPEVMLKEIEEKMRDLNAKPPDQVLTSVKNDLQVQHRQCLALQKHYWYQRSRIQWALFGDNNTSFFHASAVTRKRRNTVKAIKNSAGE